MTLQNFAYDTRTQTYMDRVIKYHNRDYILGIQNPFFANLIFL